ncbi:methionyl-tRNA formyltransferase [Candidatus Calescamantes bacterium]|nr:methionyl-tRNA formyltransferase [Candidatus Calescamantes bacterium]
MRIIFCGSSRFSIFPLRRLYQSGWEIIAVITSPDKPKGRGRKLSKTLLKEEAQDLSLPVYQPPSLKTKEAVSFISSLSPEVIIVAAFGKILPSEILEIPPKGAINLHPSLLPELRGPAPIPWAIILGKDKTGVTTIFMDEGIDTGDIILQEEVEILPDDTTLSLESKLSERGAELLVKTLELLGKGKAPRIPQVGVPTYAPFLNKKSGKIDWRKSAEEIYNLARGLNPWPTAYTFLDGKRFILWSTEVISEEVIAGEPGEVIGIEKERIFVSTGKGIISLKEVQLEGRKRLPVREFLKGYRIGKGVKLGKEVEK